MGTGGGDGERGKVEGEVGKEGTGAEDAPLLAMVRGRESGIDLGKRGGGRRIQGKRSVEALNSVLRVGAEIEVLTRKTTSLNPPSPVRQKTKRNRDI